MLKKGTTALSAAILSIASVSPALAHPGAAFADPDPAFDAPRGANALVGFRMPLGAASEKNAKPTVGLRLGYGVGHGSADLEGRERVRTLEFGDLRFSADGVERAELMSFDVRHIEDDPRLGIFGNMGNGNGLFLIGGLIAVGVGICLLAECFDGDDNENEPETPGG